VELNSTLPRERGREEMSREVSWSFLRGFLSTGYDSIMVEALKVAIPLSLFLAYPSTKKTYDL
jgi:hypothetical protein